MTTHEMILCVHLCRVSGDAFLCVWFWVLPPFQLLEDSPILAIGCKGGCQGPVQRLPMQMS